MNVAFSSNVFSRVSWMLTSEFYAGKSVSIKHYIQHRPCPLRPLLGTTALIEARRSRTIVVTTAHAAIKSSMIRCNWIYLESVEGVLLRWQLLDPDANVTHEGAILKRRLEKWRTASGFVAKQVAAKIQTNLVIHRNVSLLIDGIYRRYMSEASASCTNTHKG